MTTIKEIISAYSVTVLKQIEKDYIQLESSGFIGDSALRNIANKINKEVYGELGQITIALIMQHIAFEVYRELLYRTRKELECTSA